MLAAAAVIWITFDASTATPPLEIGRRWTIAATADATLRPVFVYPDYRNGLDLSGGFRIAHALSHDVEVALAGRAGATHVDDWRRLFEGGVQLTWRPQDLELSAALRHDDRLSREGALAGFRDPTGRIFLEARVFPIRRGWFAAGAALDYERALPGANRLPSGVNITAVGRVRIAGWRN